MSLLGQRVKLGLAAAHVSMALSIEDFNYKPAVVPGLVYIFLHTAAASPVGLWTFPGLCSLAILKILPVVALLSALSFTLVKSEHKPKPLCSDSALHSFC